MYVPKVGDTVRVTVERDRFGDVIDMNSVYVVGDVFPNTRKAWLEGDFVVFWDEIRPCDGIRGLLQIKMDQLTQLQREIAELEAKLGDSQLDGDAE